MCRHTGQKDSWRQGTRDILPHLYGPCRSLALDVLVFVFALKRRCHEKGIELPAVNATRCWRRSAVHASLCGDSWLASFNHGFVGDAGVQRSGGSRRLSGHARYLLSCSAALLLSITKLLIIARCKCGWTARHDWRGGNIRARNLYGEELTAPRVYVYSAPQSRLAMAFHPS